MKIIGGGTKVKGGFYWDRTDWEMAVIPTEGGILPGDTTHRFSKVSVLALLLLGPIMGALFVVFLPIIGVYLLGRNLATVTARSLRHAANTANRRESESKTR